MPSIQGWNGKHIHHRQVHRNKGYEISNIFHALRYGRGILAGLVDDVHDPHHSGHIRHRGFPGEQLCKSPADHTDKIEAVPERVLYRRDCRSGFYLKIEPVFHRFGAVSVRVLYRDHIGARKRDPFSVANDHQIEIPVRVLSGKFAEVGREIDPLPVDAADLVSPLKDPFIRTARLKIRDHGAGKSIGRGIQDHEQSESEQEVHCRTRDQDEHTSQNALIIKRAGILGSFVFPLHRAETSYRQSAKRIYRLFSLLFEQLRPHADGELRHLHAAGLGHQKMSQLMDKDQDSERKDSYQDIHLFQLSSDVLACPQVCLKQLIQCGVVTHLGVLHC